jgi:hypothetical protein
MVSVKKKRNGETMLFIVGAGTPSSPYQVGAPGIAKRPASRM